MVKLGSFKWIFLVGTLTVALAPPVYADPVKKATEVTFGQAVEIPGMVLVPGTYVIKVPDPVSHNDIVGFFNQDESQLYKLVRTIPAYRVDATDKTVITYEERANGAPDAMKKWFYPGDNWGKEFVYGKEAKLIAAAVLPAPAEAVAAVVPEEIEATPAPVAEAPAENAEAPPVPALALEPAPEVPAPITAIEELPKTASPMPLAGLFGGLCLALGGVLRYRLTR